MFLQGFLSKSQVSHRLGRHLIQQDIHGVDQPLKYFLILGTEVVEDHSPLMVS